MANIYRRGRTWWGRVTRDGHELRRSLATDARDVAERRFRDWLDQIDGAKFGERAPILFADAAMRFLTEHGPTLKPNSLARYRSSIKALHRSLQGVAMGDIGRARLAEIEGMRRRDGAAAPTIRRDLACLASIFTFCEERELVQGNPVPAYLKARRRRGLRESPPRDRYLSEEEEARLLDAATPILRNAIALAIDTGLRREELLSLTWAAVDLRAGHVDVRETKSGRPRRVPLFDRSRTILGTLPRHIASAYVLHHPKTGARFLRLEQGMKGAAKRALIPDLRWHDLRRTCGCRLLQRHGFTLHEVADWLGHASIVQTERAYAFLSADALASKARAAQISAQATRIADET